MTATAARDFKQELAEVDRELQEKNRFRDRYAANGNDGALQRISAEIAALEGKKRNIESAKRGVQEIADEEAVALDARRRREARVAANRLLDELEQQARELEGIEGHLLRKLSEVHHTEGQLAA